MKIPNLTENEFTAALGLDPNADNAPCNTTYNLVVSPYFLRDSVRIDNGIPISRYFHRSTN